jgi:hypothetical protein
MHVLEDDASPSTPNPGHPDFWMPDVVIGPQGDFERDDKLDRAELARSLLDCEARLGMRFPGSFVRVFLDGWRFAGPLVSPADYVACSHEAFRFFAPDRTAADRRKIVPFAIWSDRFLALDFTAVGEEPSVIAGTLLGTGKIGETFLGWLRSQQDWVIRGYPIDEPNDFYDVPQHLREEYVEWEDVIACARALPPGQTDDTEGRTETWCEEEGWAKGIRPGSIFRPGDPELLTMPGQLEREQQVERLRRLAVDVVTRTELERLAAA